jgi:hypothetical protein
MPFHRWILYLILFSWLPGGYSQELNDVNNAFIIGQVTRTSNNGPIWGHEVTIMSDTTYNPNFIYIKKVYTDKEGLYFDTIPTEALKGALYIFTVDYFNTTHDTTVYYRFNWSKSNVVQANFKLPVELPTYEPQADFKIVQNPNGGDNLFYQFIDNTNEENILSWLWDFGDGASSFLQNPQHGYGEPGLYYVTLTIMIQDSVTMVPYQSSILKVVHAKLENYFHLGGHIKAGYFPIDKGDAYLYKIEGKDYVTIDTAVFNNELGFYIFPQLIEGDYIVKADLNPNSVLFNDYLQTYYSNKYFWEEADTIFLNTSSTEYNIALVPNDAQYFPGPGKLTGKIVYDAGQSGGKTGPACNIEIILFDENDELIEICHSNNEGFFELSQLDLQSYKIHAEVTGKYTIPLNVILEPGTTEIDEIKLFISTSLVHGSYTYGIHENNHFQNIGDVYPNPVLNDLHLDVTLKQSESFDISIVDSYGQILMTTPYFGSQGLNTVNLNLDKLSGGFYFIKVSQDFGEGIHRKFLKK